MSKIVIDARELRTTSGRYVERLVNYLQDLDQENGYCLLMKPPDIDGWKARAIDFETTPCPHKEFSFAEQFGLKKQLVGLQPDLVHFAFPQQPILYRGKTITTIHDLTTLRFNNPDKNLLIFKIKQRLYKFVMKRAALKAKKVITGANFVKNDVVNSLGINPDKIVVIYEAADPIADAAVAVPALEGKQFIMYVGRPTPHKNLERLIETFVQVQAKRPELVLVLAGKKDANYERIEAKANKKNIKNLLFTGFVSEGQLRWLYENCQAYVFPSLSEGFGLPGLEAMVHGAPVISSDATCLPEIYGQAARYFNPLDVQEMTRTIEEVLSNDQLRSELIKLGRDQAAKYSWRKTAEQTLAVYQKVLKG